MSKTACIHAIRRFCLDCMGGSPSLVRSCEDHACQLHPFRLPEPPDTDENPLRAVRRHCLICAGNSREVRRCPARPGKTPSDQACALWPHRLGLSARAVARLAKKIQKARSLKLPGLE